MHKSIVTTDRAPAAIGPYSQAVKAGAFLFCSGQVALDAKSGEFRGGPVAEQTRVALSNLKEVLAAGGATLADVVKTTIYLIDMNDFATVNEVYSEFMGDGLPARATVSVAGLPKGAAVEIEAIAHVGEGK